MTSPATDITLQGLVVPVPAGSPNIRLTSKGPITNFVEFPANAVLLGGPPVLYQPVELVVPTQLKLHFSDYLLPPPASPPHAPPLGPVGSILKPTGNPPGYFSSDGSPLTPKLTSNQITQFTGTN